MKTRQLNIYSSLVKDVSAKKLKPSFRSRFIAVVRHADLTSHNMHYSMRSEAVKWEFLFLVRNWELLHWEWDSSTKIE